MKKQSYILKGTLLIALVLGASVTYAQKPNTWRGNETESDWNNKGKWKLKHVPTSDEAIHFRETKSTVKINSTVQLNNGIFLYGKELSLQGDGTINLPNKNHFKRTIKIPASSIGSANLTLGDNISINGRLALSAKNGGTTASKGTITLKDRSNVTGSLAIGTTSGIGTGQVFVKGDSTYNITGLELKTKATAGGSSEIHVLGGTVRIETKENPFDIFLKDASRKIILGDSSTLWIEYNLSVSQKKEAIKSMILQDRLIAAPGCRLTPPIIQDKMIIVRAENKRNKSYFQTQEALIASIDQIPNQPSSSVLIGTDSKQKKLESLLNNMRNGQPETAGVATTVAPASQARKAAKVEGNKESNTKLAGYIVFFGTALFVLRRPNEKQEEE